MITHRRAKQRTPLLEREIEITPEMIKAGIEVFCRSNEDFESKECIVFNIFDAMSGAQSSQAVARAYEEGYRDGKREGQAEFLRMAVDTDHKVRQLVASSSNQTVK